MDSRITVACIVVAITCVFAGFMVGSTFDPPKWHAAFKRPEWWQVIMAGIGIGVIAWQARLTRKAVEAADVSAKAAKDNLELIISKERARLVVDLERLDLLPRHGVYEVRFRISILGTTPALIVDTKCAAYIVPEEWVADEETADRSLLPLRSVPSIVPADSEPIEGFAIFLLASDEQSAAFITDVNARKLFVGIRGFIIYRDVFDRERKTPFRYVWRPSLISGIGGEWMKCGSPEENRST
jgi:hypothetical protein